jgi:putative tryptophan/tyrosine transport system substrate-binding protein
LASADDPEMKARLARFRQGFEKRGWSEGRNVLIDYRYAPADNVDQTQVMAKELVALQPDVILAQATMVITALQRESRAIPIVFVGLADPIGSGFVANLPRPGSNVTVTVCWRHRKKSDRPAAGFPIRTRLPPATV